jgi:hypothetical protein
MAKGAVVTEEEANEETTFGLVTRLTRSAPTSARKLRLRKRPESSETDQQRQR